MANPKKLSTQQRIDKVMQSKTLMPCVTFYNETIIVFPSQRASLVTYIGVGLILKVIRGETFDVVKVTFGPRPRKIRDVIVVHNIARRQLLTLKRGQYALFYGEMKLCRREQAKGKWTKYWQFYSWNNSGLFVPKMFDVKKYDNDVNEGIETDHREPMEENMKEQYEPLVDDILNQNLEDLYEPEEESEETKK